MSLVGKYFLFCCGQFVVGVGAHGHGRCGAAQAVADAAVVLRAADEDTHGFVVEVPAQDVIDQGAA